MADAADEANLRAELVAHYQQVEALGLNEMGLVQQKKQAWYDA